MKFFIWTVDLSKITKIFCLQDTLKHLFTIQFLMFYRDFLPKPRNTFFLNFVNLFSHPKIIIKQFQQLIQSIFEWDSLCLRLFFLNFLNGSLFEESQKTEISIPHFNKLLIKET